MCCTFCLLTIHVLSSPTLVSATPSNVTYYCHFVQDPPPQLVCMSLPPSATSTDLLNQVLQHVGVPSAHLESANLKIGYKLLCPYGEGVSADFVAPLQEFSIQDFLCRVPADDLGSRLLHVSMFSEDPTIFDQMSRPCSGLLLHRMSTRNGPTSPGTLFFCPGIRST